MKTDTHDFKKSSYSLSEITIFGFALSLIFFAAYLNFSTTSLRHFFFKTLDDELLSTPIGKIVSRTGYTSRERASEGEFKTIFNNDIVYPNDTLMTGHNSSMIVELKNGQRFKMDPDALIKLSFDFDFSFSGLIARHIVNVEGISKAVSIAKVEPTTVIVKPVKEVKKKEEKPKIPEIPLLISDLKPALKTEFFYIPEEFISNHKSVILNFRLNKPETDLSVHIFSRALNQEVFSAVPKMDGLLATTDIELNPQVHPPGDYIWEIHDSEGKSLGQSSFKINPVVQIIKALETENTNTRMHGFATQKNFSGFTLHWQPIEGIGKYKVKIFNILSNKQVLSKEISSTSLILNRNKPTENEMYYTVQRNLTNKFIATSAAESFAFHFLAPELKSPSMNLVMTPEILKLTGNLIFFTWTKTNYTNFYEIEISQDPSFKESRITKRIKNNFFSHKLPDPGKYYWHVRAYTSLGKNTPYSDAYSLTLLP